jgi:anti-sigma B factor antagonist
VDELSNERDRRSSGDSRGRAMELHVKQINSGVTAIELEGEMDLYNSHKLKEQVQQVFDQDARALILDFQHLEYIDSSGISVLLYAFTQAKKRNLGLWFVHVHGPVRKVIELTSLLGFFPIADSYEDALNMLS